MGVPISEVDYTSATTGRGDHEVRKGHVVVLGVGKSLHKRSIPSYLGINTPHHDPVQYHSTVQENSGDQITCYWSMRVEEAS
jgi:inosine-uridine nucleoside N-ribohydrolase